ncbi:MAG: hypothetical protein LBE99_03080 [Puniceicoccales bacterium]|jgi:hypothetical protein|nr:hypothetical protein [Puniceicoccales bacterium]
MKNSFHKFLTKILFCATIFGALPKSHAGWFAFHETSLLSPSQQIDLQHAFVRTLVTKCFYFASQLKDDLLRQLLSQATRGVPLGNAIYGLLLCEGHRQADLDDIFSTINADVVQLNFQRLHTKNNCLQSLTSEDDGLFNAAIRETVRTFVGSWQPEQLEEGFNVVWESLIGACDLTSIPEETITNLSDKYENIRTHFDGLIQAEGNNVCEKFAHYLASALMQNISEQTDVGCCGGCLKTCFKVSTEYIVPLCHVIVKIIEITAK